MTAMTQDEFIKRVTKLWSGKFDYSLTEYTGTKNKITIICPVHGQYRQKAAAHLIGKDCAKCARVNSENYMWGKGQV